ncbi:hypothetical protein AX16_008905 [Volvariella volvacea WC 439]|nr:hypothetical protein AX16_008905 [Volvariella volvacea WC 439]
MSTAATTSAAATAISNVIVHKPASPFAKLLRSSRFASYDPAIRQTYSAPPANAHRGDWGLKRPIALRRKNAFISLTNFESPAQFTEWNNAENQVRFIKRIDEMGTLPKVNTPSPWQRSLGVAQTQWLLDSDFCPEEDHTIDGGVAARHAEAQEAQSVVDESRIPTTTDLTGLGTRGPGQYGANRTSDTRSGERHLTPNLEAMSRREFVRYLRKLRELRPAFKTHIEEAARKNSNLRDKSLYDLAQDPTVGHHQRFIEAQTAEEFKAAGSTKIAQQPHPNAALTYSHPSPIDSYFHTKPQPGWILHNFEPKSYESRYAVRMHEPSYVTGYGGLIALASRKRTPGKIPLFDFNQEPGLNKSTSINKATAYLRPATRGLILDTPPRVVGRNAQGLKAVRIAAEVVADEASAFSRSNPHTPGSEDYIAQDPAPRKPAVDFASERRKGASSKMAAKKVIRNKQEHTQRVMTTLRGMLKKNPEGDANGA